MAFNDEERRKFLKFTTGSDRAPYVFCYWFFMPL